MEENNVKLYNIISPLCIYDMSHCFFFPKFFIEITKVQDQTYKRTFDVYYYYYYVGTFQCERHVRFSDESGHTLSTGDKDRLFRTLMLAKESLCFAGNQSLEWKETFK